MQAIDIHASEIAGDTFVAGDCQQQCFGEFGDALAFAQCTVQAAIVSRHRLTCAQGQRHHDRDWCPGSA
ncbi:hypothetical protein SSPSH_003494 [Salinisphaera shabanensis E1L3A]|uniref:Uncharacterized protein n=1 Tax=Salinisphaera shabanensis E1L3A TaxID=1033802 RepID=U2E1D7_9GAMM|nr:hypothetical protein SSPSH_003494 [Salinisphaera shabanensis E1L3A]